MRAIGTREPQLLQRCDGAGNPEPNRELTETKQGPVKAKYSERLPFKT
jgi:hypothetical protein